MALVFCLLVDDDTRVKRKKTLCERILVSMQLAN